MAGEEPEVRLDVELGNRLPLAVLAARLADLGDAVEHQHRRQRQLRIAFAEQLPSPAGEHALVIEARPPFPHPRNYPRYCRHGPPPPLSAEFALRTPRT